MFIWLIEYGLVPMDDCGLSDMSFLFWSGFCMAESWARRLSLSLACKPFPVFVRVPELVGDARQ